MTKIDYFFFGVLLLCVLVVVRYLLIRRAARHVWIDFAVKRNLKFFDFWDTGGRKSSSITEEVHLPHIVVSIISTFVMPRVLGKSKGFPFELSTKTKGSGEYTRSYCFMKLQVDGLPARIHLFHRNSNHRVQKIFSNENIKTGDPDFDRIFTISGEDPTMALAYLTDKRRIALKRYWMELPDLEIRHGTLYLERRGLIQNMNELELFYRKLGELAIELK